MGGFDTHDNENRGHADLMARLSHALGYFDTVLGALGLRDRVTAVHRVGFRSHVHNQRRWH